VAFLDLTTGDFRVTETETDAELEDELARLQPTEILADSESAARYAQLRGLQVRDGFSFLHEQCEHTLREHFGVHSLDGFGCAGMGAGVCAAGAILHYIKELRRQADHVRQLRTYKTSEYLVVDAATQTNLELVTSRGQRKDTSLLAAMDRTLTPMGSRTIREWILHPLVALPPLVRRQDFIGELLAAPLILGTVREVLREIRDMERTVVRLSHASGNARDLLVLGAGLARIPTLREPLVRLATSDAGHPLSPPRPADPESLASRILAALEPLPHLVELLDNALLPDAPPTTKEGGMIKAGYHADLDELRSAASGGRDWITALQSRLADETKIKTLKIKYNSVFGYFIEVTNSHLGAVPPTWHRKQTVAGGERFITPELKEMEMKISGADDRARELERSLFEGLRDEVLRERDKLLRMGKAVGELDALCGLAETARLYGYCRPALTEGLRIQILDGRHPVLDQQLVEEKFVPNDVELDGDRNRLLILTGPNMAGKSTYIRQTALLVLMAQTGSWIPAKTAEIGLVDRIFTRVGASDDMAKGQSTFMVEMNETANIMNNATFRSLVILDEIGRGTSTFDGLSIAWSVAEYLHDRLRSRALFATHYHELTELEITKSGVRNYNVAVREWNDQVIFLRKIVKGGADKSYGIQVARLAGLPAQIIERAKEILNNLEQTELNADGRPALAEAPPLPAHARPQKNRRKKELPPGTKPQLSLF
jgi:DNA mismatch repair protein MutS